MPEAARDGLPAIVVAPPRSTGGGNVTIRVIVFAGEGVLVCRQLRRSSLRGSSCRDSISTIGGATAAGWSKGTEPEQ